MFKKKKYLIMIVIVMSLMFASSFYGYLRYSKSYKHNSEIYENSNSVMSEFKFENTVNSNTKLIFKTLYAKSGEEVIEEKIAGKAYGDIIGFNREKLVRYFEKDSYKLEGMNSKEVVLTRKIGNYSPNKYVVGIKKLQNCEVLAIFKTDDKGNMYIESDEDITDFKIDMLGKMDIDILREGDKNFQFGSRHEAMEMITNYDS
ncbi:hypothetical protein ACER0A_006210 [Haloimpatiens sp. FM7315]|uniref:hypothetical protein n=1 Tax=Haloimpatiens sp. FM7315 TaxID=3298609 RepID=UPI0035A29408